MISLNLSVRNPLNSNFSEFFEYAADFIFSDQTHKVVRMKIIWGIYKIGLMDKETVAIVQRGYLNTNPRLIN